MTSNYKLFEIQVTFHLVHFFSLPYLVFQRQSHIVYKHTSSLNASEVREVNPRVSARLDSPGNDAAGMPLCLHISIRCVVSTFGCTELSQRTRLDCPFSTHLVTALIPNTKHFLKTNNL